MATVAATPERSLVQRMDALARANDVRSRRAALKQRIKRGEQPAVAVVRFVPDEAETMKVFDLLLAMPKHGRVKANKILARTRISPSKTVGGLTERQRGELASVMVGGRPTRGL